MKEREHRLLSRRRGHGHEEGPIIKPGRFAVPTALAAGAAAMLAPLMLSADDYQFIIRGDPIAAATSNSCASASIGTALVTSTRTNPTAATSLEARYRTFAPTAGVKLRSDAPKGMILVVK